MNKVGLYIYSLSFLLFGVFTYLFVDVHFVYLRGLFTGISLYDRQVTTFLFIIFILVFFACYVLILNRNELKIGSLKKVLLFPAIAIFFYPVALSFDLFNYIATAKVVYHYLENPYLVMPIAFLGDPILLFTHAANKIALYGPLWIFLTSIPYHLSFGNYLLSIVLFKLLIFLFFFGMVWLIWKITKSTFAVVYFAASPLVLIETFVSGHNDVVMMFFALLFIYFLRNKKIIPAIVFLTLSILIKYATIFLIPLFFYYIYKNLKREQINWEKFCLLGFVLMLIVFFLSPIREEIYPWYAIWPLTFLSLVRRNWLHSLFIVFSFSLMLRYVPFMLIGTYFGPTPNFKLALTFVPSAIYVFYLIYHRKIKLFN